MNENHTFILFILLLAWGLTLIHREENRRQNNRKR